MAAKEGIWLIIIIVILLIFFAFRNEKKTSILHSLKASVSSTTQDMSEPIKLYKDRDARNFATILTPNKAYVFRTVSSTSDEYLCRSITGPPLMRFQIFCNKEPTCVLQLDGNGVANLTDEMNNKHQTEQGEYAIAML